MEGLLDKIKKDVKKGLKEGIAAVSQGANAVSLKMNELSAEGKRQYKMFDMIVKIQDEKNEMGNISYAVLASGKSLDEDKKVKAAYTKIKKLEWQLGKLKGSNKIKVATPKKPAAPKKTAAAKKPATKAKAAPKKSAKSAAK